MSNSCSYRGAGWQESFRGKSPLRSPVSLTVFRPTRTPVLVRVPVPAVKLGAEVLTVTVRGSRSHPVLDFPPCDHLLPG